MFGVENIIVVIKNIDFEPFVFKMLKHRYRRPAAMLAVKRSAGVAPEVNLGNPLHVSKKTRKQGIHRGISSPTKATYVLQKIPKKVLKKILKI